MQNGREVYGRKRRGTVKSILNAVCRDNSAKIDAKMASLLRRLTKTNAGERNLKNVRAISVQYNIRLWLIRPPTFIQPKNILFLGVSTSNTRSSSRLTSSFWLHPVKNLSYTWLSNVGSFRHLESCACSFWSILPLLYKSASRVWFSINRLDIFQTSIE